MSPLKLPMYVAACMLASCQLLPSIARAQDTEDAGLEIPGDMETTTEPVDTPADTEAQAAIDEALILQARVDRDRYEQVVADLELQASADTWNADLNEAYLNLAGTLDVLGIHDEAAIVYDKALQNTRIGNGLNNLQQLPILEALLENSLEQQDWEKADSYAHLAFHIARRNYAIGDTRRTDALNRLSQWKLRVAKEELTGSYRQYARDTIAIYRTEMNLVEETAGDFENEGVYLASLHLGEARAKLALAEQVLEQPLGDFRTTGQQTITTQRCRPMRLPDGRMTQICETVEVPNIDYYLDPSVRKNQEISQNLLDIRRAILDAFDELQKDGDIGQRNALLAEMQEITKAYNAFVTDNSL